jgi:tripartite ATP-independent transporter DctP family solute receptor
MKEEDIFRLRQELIGSFWYSPTKIDKEGHKMSKRTWTIFVMLFFVVGLFCMSSSTFAADEVIKYRLATAVFPGMPTHTWTIKFAELIKEKTNGKYEIQPMQERKLGGDKDTIELVGAGAVEIGQASSALFDNFFPDLDALQMPFLITGYDSLEKVFLADYTTDLLAALEKLNLHALGLVENGFRSIGNNVRPIYKPEDLNGIKLRVAETKMHQEIFKALGAIPIPVSYGEIYTSLKTGVINGTEINATSASSEKLMEVIKYFSVTGHFFWPSAVFINKNIWARMPPEDQKIFEESFRALVPWQIALCKEKDKQAMETMEKRGIKINQADSKLFFEKSKPIYDKYMQFPAVAKFVKAVRAMQE